ncbi:glucose-1-phosphate adenylyltransferase subunit GlgD [Eubacteriaceae bacterium ES2]|nr:glucose-1-phosphate adenylyltransferase subunit GlgD [Eubacteriaceae bacterium ES2]
MKNVLGIILNIDGEDTTLKNFLEHRSLSTLPFGGRYRLIDFMLSNMVNSGITQIGVIGSHKYSSLVDHLGTGKEWSLSRKTQDLSILTGSSNSRIGNMIKINLRNLLSNRIFIASNPAEHVLLATPNLVTSYNFKEAFTAHLKNDADITMVYKQDQSIIHKLRDNDLCLELMNDRISNIHFCKMRRTSLFFTEMLLIKKSILLKFLEFSERSGDWDLIDMIQSNMDTLNIFGFNHTGYLKRVDTLINYVDTSMDLLEYEVVQELFRDDNPIYTKIKDNHPTYFNDPSKVSSSIIGSGCIIDGAVSRSIIFRDTEIDKNSKIQNSILMQHCQIGKNAILNYVVMDKDIVISDNTSLIGKPDSPIVIKKGTVI